MKAATLEIVAEIERSVADGAHIAPVTFTACYPRANVSAAFRVAKARGIIVEECKSCGGPPIYRKALRLAASGC